MKKISAVLISIGVVFTLFACQNPQLALGGLESGEVRNALPNDKPVVLEYARLEFQKNSSSQWQARLTGMANVKNLGFAKTVILHYSQGTAPTPGGDTWLDLPATYKAADSNGFEQWKFTTPWVSLNQIVGYRFALKYTVAGATYWDNNKGKDYSALVGIGFNSGAIYNQNHGVLNNGPVVLDQVKGRNLGDTFSYSIGALLKNLAFAKDLKLVYTTNNWSTQTLLNGTYSQSLDNNVEAWTFPDITTSSTQIQFALSYTVNGQTYWDNNQGRNYTFDFMRGDL